MSWSASKIFSAWLTDIINNDTAIDLGADALIEAALFNDTITPSQTVTSANSAYGAGVWASGGVVDTGTSAPAGWPALGRPLQSKTSGFASNVYTFDAADTASANSATTLTNVYGVLVYDHSIASPVADQGICYSYLGGGNSVTLGSFSLIWNSAGLLNLTI